jgi:hypothetical protein
MMNKKAKFLLSNPLRRIGIVEVQLHPFSNSALDGSKWVISRLCRFNPRKVNFEAKCIGNCMSTKVGLDFLEKKKKKK